MSSICILGGWAVHITVNKNFVESQGREYIGSKDIDVGFHINKNWSGNELKESDFARSIHALECTGFRRLSFRLVKYFHTETQKELNEQQIRELNQHLMFCLYVDPVVDAIHPKTKEILGFIPIDEHLLFYVFEKRKYTMIDSLDGKVMLPLPEVLAATKIKAIPSRDKEHKRIKDIADLYVLLWYSDRTLSTLKKELFKIMDSKKVSEVVSSLKTVDYVTVSKVLGVDATEISRVIKELIA